MLDAGGRDGLRPLAPVVRLRSVRTLVVARDLAFRKRAMTILAELGMVSFAIAAANDAENILALMTQEQADVVVLDVTGCEGSMAEVVYELCQRAPRVGVVLVATNGGDHRLGLPPLRKWGWAADLSAAVMDAYRHGNPLREDTTLRAQ